jgi:hypothetical protein
MAISNEMRRGMELLNTQEWVFDRTLKLTNHGSSVEARQFLLWCAQCIEAGIALPKPYAKALSNRLADPFSDLTGKVFSGFSRHPPRKQETHDVGVGRCVRCS